MDKRVGLSGMTVGQSSQARSGTGRGASACRTQAGSAWTRKWGKSTRELLVNMIVEDDCTHKHAKVIPIQLDRNR
jgi:hypothetical protein